LLVDVQAAAIVSRARRDSVDLYDMQVSPRKRIGRLKLVDGRIVAEGGPEIEELATMPHGKLFLRGRLVDPSEGRAWLEAVIEQYDGIGMRAEWTSSR
jgi:hypothetical protein